MSTSSYTQNKTVELIFYIRDKGRETINILRSIMWGLKQQAEVFRCNSVREILESF